MKAEDKSLLVKAICGYLPYNHLRLDIAGGDMDCLGYAHGKLIVANHLMSVSTGVEPELAKPYLRPLSSMTDKEKEELIECLRLGEYAKYFKVEKDGGIETSNINDLHYVYFGTKTTSKYTDWLNEHCFDYRGLIEKGLALPAPEGMYDFKE